MSSQDAEKLPWDRLENESTKAFAAFCRYRNFGPERSLVKSYQELKPDRPGIKPPGMWREWCVKYEWVERSRAYDLHLELIARAERETQHSAELEAYRARQQKIATATTASSLQMLQVVNIRLVDLLNEYKAWKALYDAEPDKAKRKELKKDDPLNPASLPNYLRAATAAAQVATDAEAQSLAVNELLKILEDTKSKV